MENKFPVILKKLRKEKHLSQEELAKNFDLTCSTISRYEIGIREPDQELLQKFADFFHVSIDYLLGRNEIKNQTETKPTNNRESRFTKEEIGKIESFEAWLILERNKKEESATDEKKVMGE